MSDSAPERIKGWRNSQLSIARFYGGCTYLGAAYRVCPVTDDLVRIDIFRQEIKRKKDAAKAEKAKNKAAQEGLF